MFPWPRMKQNPQALDTNVFVSCKSEESYGGSSKENVGQADVVMQILNLLRTKRNATESSPSETPLSVTILSPYSRQVKHLRGRLANDSALSKNTEVHTIDGFQGREAEVIIFTTVRSNASSDIGFLEDERRLNVALTRAQLGRIIVGNELTLREGSEIWGRAIKDCTKVELPK
jgi:superfamily I DNA and/or RNA helicase